MKNLISAALYCFCLNKEGEYCILAGKRGSTAPSEPNKYNVPTGMREYGETIEQCAQRECQEESNIHVENISYVNDVEWARGRFGANCFSLLDGTTDQHPSGQGDGENKRFEWIPISQINNYNWAYNMDKTVVYIYNKFLKDISKTKEMFSKL